MTLLALALPTWTGMLGASESKSENEHERKVAWASWSASFAGVMAMNGSGSPRSAAALFSMTFQSAIQ